MNKKEEALRHDAAVHILLEDLIEEQNKTLSECLSNIADYTEEIMAPGACTHICYKCSCGLSGQSVCFPIGAEKDDTA